MSKVYRIRMNIIAWALPAPPGCGFASNLMCLPYKSNYIFLGWGALRTPQYSVCLPWSIHCCVYPNVK